MLLSTSEPTGELPTNSFPINWTVDSGHAPHPTHLLEWHSTKTDPERNSVSSLTHNSGIQLPLRSPFWVSGNIAAGRLCWISKLGFRWVCKWCLHQSTCVCALPTICLARPVFTLLLNKEVYPWALQLMNIFLPWFTDEDQYPFQFPLLDRGMGHWGPRNLLEKCLPGRLQTLSHLKLAQNKKTK